jgi:cytochrome c5
VHALAQVQAVEACEHHQLCDAVVCDGAGNEPVVAAQGEVLEARQAAQVAQLGGRDILQPACQHCTSLSVTSNTKAHLQYKSMKQATKLAHGGLLKAKAAQGCAALPASGPAGMPEI